MHSLNISGLSTSQLLEMADGLLDGGHYRLAAQLYAVGAREAEDPLVRRRFQVRMGLARTPTAATKAMARAARELDAIDPRVFIGDGLATWMKQTPFMDDPRFVEIAEKHAHRMSFANWHWNLSTVLWAVQQTRNVPGDLMELGVFKAHTTAFVAEYVDFADWPKQWWLYDTFDGIPVDQLDPGWDRINNEVYVGKSSYQEAVVALADYSNINVTVGRVPEILEITCPANVSFMHIDLNNAAAEISALDFLIDRLSPGGIIVFDDYGWSNARAQHDAEKAWFAERGVEPLLLPTGQGLYVHGLIPKEDSQH